MSKHRMLFTVGRWEPDYHVGDDRPYHVHVMSETDEYERYYNNVTDASYRRVQRILAADLLTAERDALALQLKSAQDALAAVIAENTANVAALEVARAMVAELHDAFVVYEMDAEGEAPPKHRDMMRRAWALLFPGYANA